jgi:hypothetical protein
MNRRPAASFPDIDYPPGVDYAAELVLAVLAGESGNDCMHCALPLAGEHDGWAHRRCAEVIEADNQACYIHDNGPVDRVERKLRRRGKCPHQIRPNGWDGGAVYCGQDITDSTSDRPPGYCPQHQCETDGDDEGAAEEHWARTWWLLGLTEGS